MSTLKIGSLFSGYGGLDMAVESVTGASTAWVSDIDKGACKILAHRYPDVPNLGDLTQVDWSAVEPVDIITGGFPCQDLSHAGKGAGMASGTRSGLWSYMAEAVNIIRPKLVIAENVRGLLSAEARRFPNAKPCVCSRPDRRGGVRRGASSQGDVPGPRRGGDDPASEAGLRSAPQAVGRDDADHAASDGSLGRGVDLDAGWDGGGTTAASHRATPSDQEGAGAVGLRGGASSTGVAEASEWERGLELADSNSLQGDQGSDQAPESSGPEVCRTCGGLTEDGHPVRSMEPCPFCMGDEPDVDLRALGAVLADLADIGYDASWYGLRAADVGACHGRFRVFLVAYPSGLGGVETLEHDGRGTQRGHGASVPDERDRDPLWTRSQRGLKLLSTPDCAPEAPNTGSNSHKAGNVVGLGNQVVSLLPTPRAGDGEKGGPNQRGSSGDLMLPSAVVHMLPTPRTSRGASTTETFELLPTPAVNDMGRAYTPDEWDAWTDKMKAAHGNGNGHGKSLEIEAARLLPTPVATDAAGTRNATANRSDPDSAHHSGTTLTDALLPTPSVADATGGHARRGGDRANELLLPGLAKEIHDASATEDRPDEDLPGMRDADVQEAIQRSVGGSDTVPVAQDLLEDVREQQGVGTGGHSSLASSADQGAEVVRGLRDDEAIARSPHRQGCDEQPADEPDGSVRVLSPTPPLAAGPRRSHGVDFGQYEAAIQRWEAVLGRKAPAPTEPTGKAGAHRLSASFTEWLMGLPAGWITDVPGITRNEALKACGNGVVPQQAAAALRVLLAASQVAA